MSATRILVTGANGQVGHELLRALADGLTDRYKSHPPRSPFLRKGEEQHPFPEEGRSEHARSVGAEGAGGCRPRGAMESCEPLREIIPATRSGECPSPFPPEEGAPDGRVKVHACEAIDLAAFDSLASALDRIAPDIIINAAAYTAVDRAEGEPELAQRINGDALGVLGSWAKQHDARVVHYSTDYVFDGSATRPYRETDATHPVSVYGASKLAGEIALRDSGARHLILRTAWVYAARGHNFLRTMLRLGAEREELRVVDDQVGAPTPAGLVADVTAYAVAQWSTPPSAGRGLRAAARGGMLAPDGTYHLVASGQTSWCGFARAIFERAQRAGLIERVPTVRAINTADYPTRATRPAYSVLDTTKLRDAFDVDLPDWQTALDGVVGELAGG